MGKLGRSLIIALNIVLTSIFVYVNAFYEGDRTIKEDTKVVIELSTTVPVAFYLEFSETLGKTGKQVAMAQSNPYSDNEVSCTIPKGTIVNSISLGWKSNTDGAVYVRSATVSTKNNTRNLSFVKLFSDFRENITPLYTDTCVILSYAKAHNHWCTSRALLFNIKKLYPPIRQNLLEKINIFLFFSITMSVSLLFFRYKLEFANDSVRIVINKLIILLAALSLPFYSLLLTPLFICAFLLFIWSLLTKEADFSLLKPYLPAFAFFAVQLISLSYTNHTAQGFKILQRNVAFVLVPFMFLALPRTNHFVQTVLQAFVISTLCTAGLFFMTALLKYYTLIEHPLGLMKFIRVDVQSLMHPSYFSFFLLFTQAITLIQWRFVRNNYFLIIAINLFIVFAIYMLSSRSAFLSLGVTILFVLLTSKHWKKAVIYSILGLSAVVGMFVFTPRWDKLKHSDNISIENIDPRFILWGQAVELSKESWILGIGSGNVDYALRDKLIENGYEKMGYTRLNSHNQFLQTFIGLGIGGVLLLLLILQKLWLKDRLTVLFLLHVCTMFMFEVFLNRQVGVAIFAFWWSLFVWRSIEPISSITSNKH